MRMTASRKIFIALFLLFCTLCGVQAQGFLLVELNCENLFDTRHDEGKQDEEFLPEGGRHWSRTKYWRKLNHTGQTILSCANELPDLVALCEVENDTVLHDLTRRSLLRNAGYEYLATQSPDVRGLDVALLYRPAAFRPICYESIGVPTIEDMHPTRDILYIKGETLRGDTLHLFVIHAPSRYGGELESRPFRLQVASLLAQHVKPVSSGQVIVAGDFNDYDDSPALLELEKLGLVNITKDICGKNGIAHGTYRYQGAWRSLDHVLVSSTLQSRVAVATINDAPFLLEPDPRYGGKRPKRTFQGFKYQRDGFSDHLPLVVRFE